MGFYLRKKGTGQAGGRAVLCWGRVWLCWAHWAGLGMDLALLVGWAWDLAFCVWSTLCMSSSCLHDGFLIWLIYLRCLGSMLVSFVAFAVANVIEVGTTTVAIRRHMLA